MYQINYKNLKKGYSFYGIFLIVGLIFTILFLWLMYGPSIKKLSMDGEVKAYEVDVRISGSGKMRSAIYYYEVDGKKYDYTVIPDSMTVSSQKFKEKNTIYYNSNDPSECISEYEVTQYDANILFIIFILIFPIIGLKGIINNKKRIDKVKNLAQNGTLIKNLKYELVRTGMKVNGRKVMAIQVEYELPSGSVIKLTGDPRYDFKSHDADGYVDLLIDLNDIDNYYIDFDIS